MAYELPAKTAWPALVAEQSLEPGQPHLDGDVGRIVKEQHYLLAYFGTGHVAQQFGWLTDEIPLCRAITTSFVQVATYLIRPRRHAQKLVIVAQCNSDKGGTLRVDIPEATGGAVQLDLVFAAGLGVVETDITDVIDRGDLVTLVHVSMKMAAVAGATSIDLLTFCCADADLAVGDLP